MTVDFQLLHGNWTSGDGGHGLSHWPSSGTYISVSLRFDLTLVDALLLIFFQV